MHLKKCNRSVLAKAKLIERISWASHFSRKQVVALARYMDSYQAPPGEIILSEGGRDSHLLLVVSGRVEIVKSVMGTVKTLATIGPGESFGEMSLIDGKPRSASAIAATAVSLLLLSQENFTRLHREEPTLGVVLLFKFADLMSHHLRQTSEILAEHL